jgi:hypothetical protein
MRDDGDQRAPRYSTLTILRICGAAHGGSEHSDTQAGESRAFRVASAVHRPFRPRLLPEGQRSSKRGSQKAAN